MSQYRLQILYIRTVQKICIIIKPANVSHAWAAAESPDTRGPIGQASAAPRQERVRGRLECMNVGSWNRNLGHL